MYATKMKLQPQRIVAARMLMLLFAASLVSGCTIPVTGVLFNNSDSQIVAKIILDEREIQQIEISAKTSVKLKDWLLYDMRILFEGTEYRYDRHHPGSAFVNTTGFGPFTQRQVFLEFESDARIFIMKSRDQFGESPPAQPEGFPMVGK